MQTYYDKRIHKQLFVVDYVFAENIYKFLKIDAKFQYLF